MTGTSFSQTRETLLRPPRMTKATRIVTTRPMTHVGMLSPSKSEVAVMAPASEFDCTEAPMPKEAMAVNSAKRTARSLPRPLFLKPRSRAYMAPPIILPFSSFTRHFTPM